MFINAQHIPIKWAYDQHPSCSCWTEMPWRNVTNALDHTVFPGDNETSPLEQSFRKLYFLGLVSHRNKNRLAIYRRIMNNQSRIIALITNYTPPSIAFVIKKLPWEDLFFDNDWFVIGKNNSAYCYIRAVGNKGAEKRDILYRKRTTLMLCYSFPNSVRKHIMRSSWRVN